MLFWLMSAFGDKADIIQVEVKPDNGENGVSNSNTGGYLSEFREMGCVIGRLSALITFLRDPHPVSPL